MRVLLAALSTMALASSAMAQSSGAETFEDRCSMCHILGATGQGPNLKGVVGRKAGSAPGFTYTAALKTSGLIWSPANLDKFLTNPNALVPGTAMLARVNDAAQRESLIRYLAAQH